MLQIRRPSTLGRVLIDLAFVLCILVLGSLHRVWLHLKRLGYSLFTGLRLTVGYRCRSNSLYSFTGKRWCKVLSNQFTKNRRFSVIQGTFNRTNKNIPSISSLSISSQSICIMFRNRKLQISIVLYSKDNKKHQLFHQRFVTLEGLSSYRCPVDVRVRLPGRPDRDRAAVRRISLKTRKLGRQGSDGLYM